MSTTSGSPPGSRSSRCWPGRESLCRLLRPAAHPGQPQAHRRRAVPRTPGGGRLRPHPHQRLALRLRRHRRPRPARRGHAERHEGVLRPGALHLHPVSPGGMRVPLLDLKAQYATIRQEVREAVDRVLENQQFILGAEVTALEEAVAHYVGARHGVGMSSGTDALLAALMALDVGPGDRVIGPAYSFFATAGVAVRL